MDLKIMRTPKGKPKKVFGKFVYKTMTGEQMQVIIRVPDWVEPRDILRLSIKNIQLLNKNSE